RIRPSIRTLRRPHACRFRAPFTNGRRNRDLTSTLHLPRDLSELRVGDLCALQNLFSGDSRERSSGTVENLSVELLEMVGPELPSSLARAPLEIDEQRQRLGRRPMVAAASRMRMCRTVIVAKLALMAEKPQVAEPVDNLPGDRVDVFAGQRHSQVLGGVRGNGTE